jgi:hypothetical protein
MVGVVDAEEFLVGGGVRDDQVLGATRVSATTRCRNRAYCAIGKV